MPTAILQRNYSTRDTITENVANPAKESSLQAHLYWDSTSILFDPGHRNLKRGYSREEVMTTLYKYDVLAPYYSTRDTINKNVATPAKK